MPTDIQAANYSATMQWLKAVQALKTTDADKVMDWFKKTPLKEVHCQATVAGKFLDGGTPCVRLDLRVYNQAGEPRLTGTAVVALPGPRRA